MVTEVDTLYGSYTPIKVFVSNLHPLNLLIISVLPLNTFTDRLVLTSFEEVHQLQINNGRCTHDRDFLDSKV